jgi:hypothetical protein
LISYRRGCFIAADRGTGFPLNMAKKSSRRPAPKYNDRRPAPQDLRIDLRKFVTSRPHGWNHDDWVALLAQLEARGYVIEQPERIGNELERERLRLVLASVAGMGPRRINAVVEHFATLWQLCQASVDDVAALPNIPRELAERALQTVRQQAF